MKELRLGGGTLYCPWSQGGKKRLVCFQVVTGSQAASPRAGSRLRPIPDPCPRGQQSSMTDPALPSAAATGSNAASQGLLQKRLSH